MRPDKSEFKHTYWQIDDLKGPAPSPLSEASAHDDYLTTAPFCMGGKHSERSEGLLPQKALVGTLIFCHGASLKKSDLGFIAWRPKLGQQQNGLRKTRRLGWMRDIYAAWPESRRQPLYHLKAGPHTAGRPRDAT